MSALRIITTGTGYFRGGLTGQVVGPVEMRTVFLGAECIETQIPEFPILIDGSRKGVEPKLCQVGRDFNFLP